MGEQNKKVHMKKFLLLCLIVRMDPTFPGTPDQDPNVKDIRDQFENGSTLSAKDVVGKIFKCARFSAIHNDFFQYTYRLSFWPWGDILRQRFSIEDDAHPFDESRGEGWRPYADMALVTQFENAWIFFQRLYKNYIYPNGRLMYGYGAYRMSSHGELLSEFSVTTFPDSPESLKPLAPHLDQTLRVRDYDRCFLESTK